MKIKRKFHFFFGKDNDTGVLFLNRSASNIFITLADFNNNVIRCQTSGSSGITESKRRKKSPHAIEQIVKALAKYFKLYKITKIKLILKIKVNTLFYFLSRELSFLGVNIIQVLLLRPVAFNGVRGRKLRRL